MAVAIDVKNEEKVELRNLETGVPLALEAEAKKAVVLTKFISNDPRHADWQPQGEWLEQVVVDVARPGRAAVISVEGRDGEQRGVTIDDGLIIDLVGTFSGLVGITAGQPPMTQEQVADYEASTERSVPMYQRWDFRIKRILKTNGPEARASLARSEDQKRAQSQSDMFQAIAAAFREGTSKTGGQASAQATLDAGIKVAK